MRGLVVHIAVALVVTLALNGMIFAFGWNLNPTTRLRPSFAPPGPVIGAIWTILIAGMAASLWKLRSLRQSGLATGVVVLLAVCLGYPFYALASNSQWVGFAGNLVTLGLAAGLAWKSWPISRFAAVPLVAVTLWVSYATLIVIALLRG
ncbi:tryptophan-rich sensory protein [Lacibacterium aquatile]|uniref:Tryptophan-rich sensory protein n=1 Tax=Lacibacterium aquatile TaxID=1168082 RepID=A0ABW5DUT6_9PROT